MRNAQYLRAQAEFCLEVARQMSDHRTVENLQAEAARYRNEALEVETKDFPESSESPRSGGPQKSGDVSSRKRDRRSNNDLKSSHEKRAYLRLLRHLLSDKLRVAFKDDQVRPLPPRMADLLKRLEHPTGRK
jgi:hypothetical protein